ncbi:MAG: chemotaxis protein CheA [Spirochaetes bacterium]|nr:chemotaxis protein CheA [Spirochaetota bacterium]
MEKLENFEEFFSEFIVEANEMIENMEQSIIELEKDNKNREKINEIFRGAHTIKGSSATLGLNDISKFAHIFEDSLDFIRRNKNLPITSELIDIILEGIDTLKLLLQAKQNNEVKIPDIEDIIKRIENIPSMYSINVNEKEKERKVIKEEKEENVEEYNKKVKKIEEYEAQKIQNEEKNELIEKEDKKNISIPKSKIDEMFSDVDFEYTKLYKITVYFSKDDPMASVGPIQVYSSLRDLGVVYYTYPEYEILKKNEFHQFTIYFFSSNKNREVIYNFTYIPDTTTEVIIKELNKDDLLEFSADKIIDNNKDDKIENYEKGLEEDNSNNEVYEEDSEKFNKRETEEKTISKYDVNEEEKFEENKSPAVQVKQKTIIRVDSERVDELLNMVSQLVINKASFSDSLNRLSDSISKISNYEDILIKSIKDLIIKLGEKTNLIDFGNEIFENFEKIINSFSNGFKQIRSNLDNLQSDIHIHSNIINQMRDSVMKVRMVPIEQLYSRFPRIVRDLQKKLNKDIELILEGQDTELDKSIIEELNDPLMHMLRNCIDHGIESPAERKAIGKNPIGKVKISARNEGSIIYISVSDDGRGIDYNEVRKKAIDKGLISPNDNLTISEIYNFLFLPGFSTAKKVSEVSGRGVGLDVVKKSIEKLNGTVSVDSKVGYGTTFTIKLPLTLAIIKALMVDIDNEVYAIPIDSIFETKRIEYNEIFKIENKNVIKLRNEFISVIILRELFSMGNIEDFKSGYLVIVGFEGKKVGLVVDNMLGEEDIVIKPLSNKLTKVTGISGASILGNGDIALILDVNQLVEFQQVENIEQKETI